jgi:hypothetical protein
MSIMQQSSDVQGRPFGAWCHEVPQRLTAGDIERLLRSHPSLIAAAMKHPVEMNTHSLDALWTTISPPIVDALVAGDFI